MIQLFALAWVVDAFVSPRSLGRTPLRVARAVTSTDAGSHKKVSVAFVELGVLCDTTAFEGEVFLAALCALRPAEDASWHGQNVLPTHRWRTFDLSRKFARCNKKRPRLQGGELESGCSMIDGSIDRLRVASVFAGLHELRIARPADAVLLLAARVCASESGRMRQGRNTTRCRLRLLFEEDAVGERARAAREEPSGQRWRGGGTRAGAPPHSLHISARKRRSANETPRVRAFASLETRRASRRSDEGGVPLVSLCLSLFDTGWAPTEGELAGVRPGTRPVTAPAPRERFWRLRREIPRVLENEREYAVSSEEAGR